jgi:integrase
MKHVQHVRGKWIARVTVPDDLREIIGKRELVAELPTDKVGRDRRAHAVLNGFFAKLEEARDILVSRRPTLSSAAKSLYRTELEADDLGREFQKSGSAEVGRAMRAVYANKLRLLVADKVDRDEAEALIGYAANDLVQRGQAPDIPRRDLLRALAEVKLEALMRFEERDDGKVKISPPTLSILTEVELEPKVMTPGARGTGTTLSDVLTAFHKERNAGGRSLAPKTMDEHKTAVRMFEEFAGTNIPAKSITKLDVISYKQALLETPTRYTLRFPGLTLPQAMKANANRAEPYETLNPKTINMKWLSHLSSILQWASNNGHIDINPAQGIRVDTGSALHREPSRLPFDTKELCSIFGHEMFSAQPTYGLRQWALLLALYTGARSSSEIARIKLSDIYDEQGIWVFDLQGASKNQHSKRLVPIHDDLKTLGLLDYVNDLRARGDTLLFSEWDPEDKVNRWFLRTFLPKLKIDAKEKVFHSFRHNLKTELVRSGCTKELHDLITGHDDQSVSAVYVHDVPIKRMAEALNRVKFKLPLPGLKARV